MPWREPPLVDFEQEPQYRWPFWEVGCQEEDLFGELHQRFNTTPYPAYIQDPESFHRDVLEIARQAHDKDDFFARMQRRRDERFAELDRFRRRLFILHNNGFNKLDDTQMHHLTRMNYFASLDSIVALYASLLAPDEAGREPSLEFFMSPRQLGILEEKEKRLSPATAKAKDHAGADQSMMPTPPGRRQIASPKRI
ncbi:hypothetical protein G6O67_008669 [Ophiocordyceps sinensis]|uniref:Uncharacterized protein n=1 Tax=Ophiocordyceps sinensis TaxID=72228 RepID=A0A8H4LRP9_9HYPO|nr:hypothetical protein G6O67_008669 [Ophiocordyceps sinensis]